MMISDLPVELQNKIMFYALEHPCAKMIKNQIQILTKKMPFNDMSYFIDNGLFVSGTKYFGKYQFWFKRPKIVGRWCGICVSTADILKDDRTDYGRRPITFGKLLDYLSYLSLNDIEQTWLRQRVKTTNNSLVLL